MGDLESRVDSLEFNVHGDRQLWQLVRDLTERLDTLQTPWWKRALFRLDGWPGQTNLNAAEPAWRPWRRWWTS